LNAAEKLYLYIKTAPPAKTEARQSNCQIPYGKTDILIVKLTYDGTSSRWKQEQIMLCNGKILFLEMITRLG